MHASTPVWTLHVADDPDRAASTATALARTDTEFETEIATSAEEGVRRVRNRPPDCVVSDHDLPGLDGLGFLRAVRETHPELPFVLYTDSGSETVASEAISAGVTDYLRRDIGDHEQLADRVEEAVSEHRADRPDELRRGIAEAPTAVLRVDSNGEVASANRRAGETLAAETGEIVGRPCGELPLVAAGDEQTGSVESLFGRVLDSGEPVEGVPCEVVLSDESSRAVEMSGVPMTDAGNTGEGVFVVADTTADSGRLRTLERRNEYLEHSPDVVTVLTATGTVAYQSPTPDSAQFDPRYLLGESPHEYVHPADREHVLSEFRELTTRGPGETVRTEFRFSVAGGEYRWFENRATNYLGHEPIDGILVVSRDITERKRAEQSLTDYAKTVTRLQRSTRELLEATDIEQAAEITIESTREAFDFDAAGLWRSTEEQTRLEPVAITQSGESLIEDPPAYSAETESLSWEAFESQESRVIDDMADYEDRYNPETPIQSELIVPLGEYGLINIGSTERAAFNDEDINRVEIWGNIVESAFARLTQIERLEQREQELQRERNRLDEFARFVSHDLRNPLQVARGRLQLAADEHTSDHLADIEQALDRMDRLVGDVLELARQGSTVGETEQVSLGQLLSRCWGNVGTAAAELDVQTERRIRADGSRLASAVENLFRNAVEHGGEGVTVTAGTVDGQGFYIADDGTGIPTEERTTVFESGYSTASGGTGLGLQIVEQVVEAHGWEVSICESTTGGARFEITGVEFVD